MKHSIAIRILGTMTAFLIGTTALNASLIGDTVTGEFTNLGLTIYTFNPSTAVVDGDIEFTRNNVGGGSANSVFKLTADLSESAIDIGILFTGGGFVLPGNDFPTGGIVDWNFKFSDLDWLDDFGNPIAGRITGVTLSNITGTISAGDIDIEFTDDSVSFDILGQVIDHPGVSFRLNLETEHDAVTEVPEPATYVVMGSMLMGVGLFARKKKLQKV